MTSQASPSGFQAPTSSWRLTWTPQMLETLVLGLIEQVRLGRRAESGFKTEAYQPVIDSIKAQMEEGATLTKAQVKSKVSWLKTMWQAWDRLRNESGVGIDHETGLLIADDEVWGPILKNVSSLLQ